MPIPFITCIQEYSWVALFPRHQGQPCFVLLQGFRHWSWAKEGMLLTYTWKQLLGKEAEIMMGGSERKGLQMGFCILGRGMLIWVPVNCGSCGCWPCPLSSPHQRVVWHQRGLA